MSQHDLFSAISTGDIKTLTDLLKQSVDLEDTSTFEGLSPLMMAVREGQHDSIKLLLEHGASPNTQGAGGIGPLHLAAINSDAAAVKILLEAGASAQVQAEMGAAVAHLAAASGAVDVLRTLVKHGVDVDEEDANGLTALNYAEAREEEQAAEFLRHAQLATFLDHIDALRASVVDVLLAMNEAESSLDERMEAEASEQANAVTHDALPEDTGENTGNDYSEMMVSLSHVRPVLDRETWQKKLESHQEFLNTGGSSWWGVWQSLVQSEVTFGLYDGPSAERGEQLDLHLHRLSDAQVDFTGATMTLGHMSGVIADGVDFNGSDLTRAFATDASFEGAVFDGATLARADFSRSNMRGASFVGADLSFTDLENCDLEGADFSGAILVGTKFPGANLTGAKR